MNINKTLCISDLDGTLLNKSAELSDYTVNALNIMINKGIRFSVATARTLASTSIILSGLTLHLPIILMNGALIYDMDRQCYVHVNEITSETVTVIIETLKRFKVTGFMYVLKGGRVNTYYESLEQKPLRDFVEERIAKYRQSFLLTKGFDNISPENVIYFTLCDTHERLKPVFDAIVKQSGLKPAMYEDVYRPGLWYLEIFSDKASKQSAVKYLRDTYSFEHIIGFGDNLNDLPMFAACNVRVAVENANPKVKTAADHICGANNIDGVAKWIEENVIKSAKI